MSMRRGSFVPPGSLFRVQPQGPSTAMQAHMHESVVPMGLRPTLNASSRSKIGERHHGAATHGYDEAAHREEHNHEGMREELSGFKLKQLFPGLSSLAPKAKPLPSANRELGRARTGALRRVGAHVVKGKRVTKNNRALLRGGARVTDRSTWLHPKMGKAEQASLLRGFGHRELRQAPT